MNGLPFYLILTADRIVISKRMKPPRIPEILDKYAPTAILPENWPTGRLLDGVFSL